MFLFRQLLSVIFIDKIRQFLEIFVDKNRQLGT